MLKHQMISPNPIKLATDNINMFFMNQQAKAYMAKFSISASDPGLFGFLLAVEEYRKEPTKLRAFFLFNGFCEGKGYWLLNGMQSPNGRKAVEQMKHGKLNAMLTLGCASEKTRNSIRFPGRHQGEHPLPQGIAAKIFDPAFEIAKSDFITGLFTQFKISNRHNFNPKLDDITLNPGTIEIAKRFITDLNNADFLGIAQIFSNVL